MKDWLLKSKSTWSTLTGFNTQRKCYVKFVAVVLIFAIFNLSIGCNSYFKVNSSSIVSADNIAGLDNAGKKIIIHFNEKKWILSDVQIKNSTVTGRLNEYKYPPTIKPVRPSKPNRFYTRPVKNQKYLLNEVHLYLDEFADHGKDMVSIPVNSISKIEIYDKDTAATAGSWFIGALGMSAGAFLVVAVIVLLTKESCPFIYTWDGENYHFAGEIYSGSIHKPVERNDYLKLPTYSGQKSYMLKITNEVKEVQNTNLLELLVFDHPKNVNILMDKYGKVATLSQPVSPVSAKNLAGENIKALVSSKDSLFYQSNSAGPKLPLKDAVIFEFPNKGKSKTAKLAIRAKNSVLLDYMLGQFHDMFGSAYKGFMKKQQKSSAADIRQWTLDQGIPLLLYVEREGKWEFVDYYNIVGPMKFKDDVLSFPLKENETDPLKLKLEFGNFLWEIDYASVDYSSDQKVTSYTLPVKTAVSEKQKNVAGLLAKDDKSYYTQPTMDNQAVLTFDLPELKDQNRTVILHSKGWYQLLRNPTGKPDIEKLKAFRQPGHFNEFVNEQMKKMEQQASQVN